MDIQGNGKDLATDTDSTLGKGVMVVVMLMAVVLGSSVLMVVVVMLWLNDLTGQEKEIKK